MIDYNHGFNMEQSHMIASMIENAITLTASMIENAELSIRNVLYSITVH